MRHPDFGMKHRVVRGLSYMSLGHYPEGAYQRVLEVYARASTRSYDPPRSDWTTSDFDAPSRSRMIDE
ncbi:MAG: hypothetical protein MPW15_18710 [Candidatus Manganitrophus sp.]|nr:hypothetical protein [Candidatus Manganitrophus sp.]